MRWVVLRDRGYHYKTNANGVISEARGSLRVERRRKVDVKIEINYGTNKRPTSFDVSYKVDGGETIKKHIHNK